MEKLKDFIYEISDIILGMIVLALIIFVFTYELRDFFNFDMITPLTSSVDTADSQDETEQNTVTTPEATSSDIAKQPENTEQSVAETPPTSSESASTSSTNKPDSSQEVKDPAEGVQSEPTPTTTTPVEQTQSESTLTTTSSPVKIIIPPGSASDVIADLLHKSGIIQSQADFLNYLQNKKLDTKLKAGTFTIPAGSSLEEIVAILTQ